MASKDPTRSLKLSQVDTYISSVPIQSIWEVDHGGSRTRLQNRQVSLCQLVVVSGCESSAKITSFPGLARCAEAQFVYFPSPTSVVLAVVSKMQAARQQGVLHAIQQPCLAWVSRRTLANLLEKPGWKRLTGPHRSDRQATRAPNGLSSIWIENAALLDTQCEFVRELGGFPHCKFSRLSDDFTLYTYLWSCWLRHSIAMISSTPKRLSTPACP